MPPLYICFFAPPLSCRPVCHWRRATPMSSGRGRHGLLAWPVRLSLAPSIAIVSAWKTMRAKARRTSTVLWCGTVAIARGAVRAPVTERGAETALEPATGERGHLFVGPVDSRVCLTIDNRLQSTNLNSYAAV